VVSLSSASPHTKTAVFCESEYEVTRGFERLGSPSARQTPLPSIATATKRLRVASVGRPFGGPARNPLLTKPKPTSAFSRFALVHRTDLKGQRSPNSLQEKEVALQRAEQKVATVEAKFDEYKKATLGDRASLEEKIAKLTEQLDAESAARLFAEGALRSARQERSARRQEGHDVAAESPSAETESADSKVTWLRR
jgi:hypothetical protein